MFDAGDLYIQVCIQYAVLIEIVLMQTRQMANC